MYKCACKIPDCLDIYVVTGEISLGHFSVEFYWKSFH